MKTKLTLFLLLLGSALLGSGQSITPTVVNAGGQTYTDSSMTLEWSIGEVALVSTLEAGTAHLMVSNGFLQPHLSGSGKSNQSFLANEVTILPSPTHGKMEVWIDTRQQGSLYISVQDAGGKKTDTRKAAANGNHVVERFDLTTKPSGTYFIYIDLIPTPGFTAKRGAYRIVKI